MINSTKGIIEQVFPNSCDSRVQDVLLTEGIVERKLDPYDLVMPGFICAHGHFYGMFARGMNFLRAQESAPASFGEVLQKLWWRLDRALDLKATKLSTQVCLASAIRAGTTTIIDHHSSPDHASRSLTTIAEAAHAAGVRCSVAFEVSDRNGAKKARQGIDENLSAIDWALSQKNGMTAASFGLHASFTLEEETLRECKRQQGKWGNVGFHVHLAEGVEDEEHSIRLWNERTAMRLARHGILGPHTVLGHGVHLSDEEMDVVKASGSMLVTNISSNANNGVGVPDVEKLLSKDILVGMGTDGMSYDMLGEYHHAYLAHKLVQRDPRAMPGDQLAAMLLDANAEIANRMFQPFGAPKLGSLESGAAADLIIVNYASPTPIHGGNLPWHMMFGMSSQLVKTSMVNGQFVLDNYKLLTLDEKEIAHQASEYCPQVWERVSSN